MRPTRAGRAGLSRSDSDLRSNPACIERGICGCNWGCIQYRPAWEHRGTISPECLLAGVCDCGWRCEPLEHMPTLNDALQLRALWSASADLLTMRLLHLDVLSERIGTESDIFVAHIGTVEQWMSFVKYLVIERNAAWVRHDMERQAAWDASGFFR